MGEQHGEHGAIQNAVGVVGDDDHRPGLRNAFEVRRFGADFDVHFPEEIFQNETRSPVPRAHIKLVSLFERQQFACERR